jgi:Kef-type K+ transport system membrane component KefB
VSEFPILQSLGYILLTAAVAVLLLRLVRVPTIVAYMAAGLLLGPVTGVLEVTDSIELISKTGIALLLFLVGLQLSLSSVQGIARIVAVTGSIQVVVIFLLGLGIGLLFGFSIAASAVLGFAATCTSTVVMVKLLSQRREMKSLHGRIGIGVSMVQDITTVLAFTVFAGLGTASAGGVSMTRAMLTAFAGVLALIMMTGLAARFLLPWLFTRVEKSPETIFIWSLAWCFLFIVVAERAGLSVELGAFIAGLGLAQLRFAEELRRRVQPIVNFFLAAFFVSLGLQMQPVAALGQWPLLLALAAATLIVKPAVVLFTLPRVGCDARTSFMSAIALGQMSEFSFILATLAFSTGVIDQTTLSVITLTGFVTISASAYLVLYGDQLFDRLRGGPLLRFFGADRSHSPPHSEGMNDHIIVIGMNSLGVAIVTELAARGETVIAIDTDLTKLIDLPATPLLGSVDDYSVLEEAQFLDSRLVVSALQIEDTNNLLAHRCRRAGVRACIHAFDAEVIEELRDIGIEHLMISKYDGTRQIAGMLRTAGILD